MDFNYNGIKIIGKKLFYMPQRLSININENFYRELKKVLQVKCVKDLSLVRVGRTVDGGYIMVDNFSQGGGIAYSFGIANEISWDADMAKRGYDVFMYDMTINGLPYENEKFHFFREGIGGVKDENKFLDTLENFIVRNGHENEDNMILKMDVEGAEWDFLENVSLETLSKFDQIVFEFHNLIAYKTLDEMNRTINLLEKINETHTLVHVHGNNFSDYVDYENIGTIPNFLEATYLRTDNHKFYSNKEIFLPRRLDMPNSPRIPDIPLGYWNKFNRV